MQQACQSVPDGWNEKSENGCQEQRKDRSSQTLLLDHKLVFEAPDGNPAPRKEEPDPEPQSHPAQHRGSLGSVEPIALRRIVAAQRLLHHDPALVEQLAGLRQQV